jgi:hypothetical protein
MPAGAERDGSVVASGEKRWFVVCEIYLLAQNCDESANESANERYQKPFRSFTQHRYFATRERELVNGVLPKTEPFSCCSVAEQWLAVQLVVAGTSCTNGHDTS